jgi:hypothetical protein
MLSLLIVPVFFVSAGLLGLLTAIVFPYPLTAPWLLISYVLFGIAMFLGAVPGRRWGMELGALLASTPDGPTTPEIRAMFDGQRVVATTIVEITVLVLLVFDMVVKPFS